MPETAQIWIDLAALAALLGVVAYALLGGADFGGGIWDLFASGPRKREQRLAIQRAMGPVWEANHVWLILVVVVLFTCFPRGYTALGIALFLPFHLALLGIMLRGAAFIFRSYQVRQAAAAAETSTWGVVFGVASLMSPVLLGAAFGVLTEGAIRIEPDGTIPAVAPGVWLSLYCLANGLLALCTCGYLAAVYLTNETTGPLREDFRRRAILAGTATAALAGLVLLIARRDAPWFFDRLLSVKSLPILAAGLFCFAGSAWAVFSRRYALSRVFSIAEIGLLVLGWGLAQHPYLIYPDVTFADAAAPLATVQFMVASLPVGAALILPSLWLLLHVFKGHAAPPVRDSATTSADSRLS
jgi:cytochrome d ubiquinol oxidase subunit II